MALKFKKLDHREIRKLKQPGEKLTEYGITFERLPKGDGRYTVNIMVDGVRVHRVLGKESDGVTREQAENFIEQARTDARKGRLNLLRPTVLPPPPHPVCVIRRALWFLLDTYAYTCQSVYTYMIMQSYVLTFIHSYENSLDHFTKRRCWKNHFGDSSCRCCRSQR